ncbi:MAG: methyltransferase domain-containing protein [Betaproteobacteria bacterium]|nr:methyltransferase domain-containing protein [Betaproteobacteria bacterium]
MKWLIAVLMLCGYAAQAAAYKPELAQPGKDVVWVPTPDALVNTMLELAQLITDDYLIDLGSGDGRLVIMAARRGARAHGIEYNADLVAYATRAAQRAGLAQKATFAKADLFVSDLSRASVITLFLSPEINLKLRPKLLALKPGTRIVSNTFTMGDWAPDGQALSSDDAQAVYYRSALLWVVPANVAGTWHAPQGRLRLTQHHQKLQGTLHAGGKAAPMVIAHAILRGAQLSFVAGDAHYAGIIKDNVIEGTLTRGDTTQPWRATRVKSTK